MDGKGKLIQALEAFRNEHAVVSKGPLAVLLHVTRFAKKSSLPLDPSSLITTNKGQVLGLGKGAIQAILAEYGIKRVLAEEGGRTSRGSLGLMNTYVAFLNQQHKLGIMDIDVVEAWWVDRIREYFASKPFVLRYDTSRSLRAMVNDLLKQAQKRQKESRGTMYVGAVLQHLVGAKLEIMLPHIKFSHHGFSVADSSSARAGDFTIEDVVIHVTTTPGEGLLNKCQANLDVGLRPIILTTSENVTTAFGLARNAEIDERVEIIDAEQFIATNMYEWSAFSPTKRKITVERLVEMYNQIVASSETDPSLRVEVG